MADSTTSGWYFAKRGTPAGQQAGPFTWEQLYAHARSGALASDDLVWHAQFPDWVPGAHIPGLFAAPTVPAASYPSRAAQPAPRRRSRLLPVLVILIVLIVVGGGLGSYFAFRHGGGGGDKPGGEAAKLTVAEVAPELTSFGELAAIEAPPVTASFDSDGGQLDLRDGAKVTVPAGALADDTSLTVTTVGLALEYFDSRVGPARTYVIETDRDVPSLEEPVILEVPFPAEVSGVAVLEDGKWVEVDVPSGETTRVEIAHFSTSYVTFIPAGIEWLAEQGWVINQQIGLLIPQVHLPPETVRLLKEQDHQKWVKTEADQSTRDFYGLDENGEYRPSTHTQEEMCAELQTAVAEYRDFSLPRDFSPYRLARHLFNAEAPGIDSNWPEFYDSTKDSMRAINQQVLASTARLTPSQLLKIAVDANQGNVPMGLLAAHEYLKDLAYLGRQYGDPLPDGKNEPVSPAYGTPAAHLEPWREADPANPAGRLDKMGPLYHIFAAAVAGVWFPNQADAPKFGDIAVGGEALMRVGLGIFAGDVPDREKGRADECGARLADTIRSLATEAEAGGNSGGDTGGSAKVEGPRWVRVGKAVVNPEGLPLEFYGGGSTPGYFGESRFEGKFTIYEPAETYFTVRDRWVDYGFESWNVTIRCDFEAPEEVLVPGRSYSLTAGFTHDGTVENGNPGEAFVYYSPSGIIAPRDQTLSHYPWSDSFDGIKSLTWTLTVPEARIGDTLEIHAGLWGAAQCTVIWTYRLE